MNMNNRFYSQWDDTSDDEYYRERSNRGRASVDAYSHASTTSGNSAHYHDSADFTHRYDDPDSGADFYHRNDRYPGEHPLAEPDHYGRDSMRGFNQIDSCASFGDATGQDDYFYSDVSADDDHYAHDDHDFIGSIRGRGKSDGIEVNMDDLRDYPRKTGGINIGKAVSMLAVIMCFVGLYAATSQLNKPELSAFEIVQQESYDGLQKAPAIFNLTNLDDCESRDDCIKNSLTASRAQVEELVDSRREIREIPAVNAGNAAPVNVISSEAIPAVTSADARESNQMLVQQQWSIIRQTPDIEGEIITSLAKGTLVRVISRDGSWIEIEALNDKRPSGYMHRSTVAPVSY